MKLNPNFAADLNKPNLTFLIWETHTYLRDYFNLHVFLHFEVSMVAGISIQEQFALLI